MAEKPQCQSHPQRGTSRGRGDERPGLTDSTVCTAPQLFNLGISVEVYFLGGENVIEIELKRLFSILYENLKLPNFFHFKTIFFGK